MKNKLLILLGCMVSVMPAFADDKASDRNSPPKTETGAQNKTEKSEQQPSAAEKLILGCMISPMQMPALAYDNASSGSSPPKTETGAQNETEESAQNSATECCCPACPPIDGKFWYCSGNGWRLDQIKFGGSKLETQNMGALAADLRLVVERHIVFEASGGYARSFLTPREGEVYDFNISTGYMFDRNLQCVPISFGPLIGYSTHHQFIKGSHHLHHLRPSYNFNWNGPFVGFAYFFSVTSKIKAYFDYQFHWQRFRSNIVERGHGGFHSVFNTTTNNAFGNQVALEAIYNLFGNWYAGLQFEFKGFWAHNSRRDHRHEDGRGHHFNANWNSYLVVSQLAFEL